MLSSLRILQIYSNLRPSSVLVISRGIRGRLKTFRTKIPKYKMILGDLPPLTDLLTQKHINDAARLRSEKLDLYKSYMPITSNLMESIFNADDIDKLLKIIDENLISMTSFYIGISFEALDDMMRAGLCSKDTVAVSPEFKRLCSKTIYKMRFLESEEIIKLLKCFSTLQVPENTLIIQATLTMAKNHINDFSLKELEILGQCLHSFEPIYKGKESMLLVLRDSIPMAMEKQIEKKHYSADFQYKIGAPDSSGKFDR